MQQQRRYVESQRGGELLVDDQVKLGLQETIQRVITCTTLDLNFRPNEKFWIGATAYWWQGDNGLPDVQDLNVNTYGIYAGFAFNPNENLRESTTSRISVMIFVSCLKTARAWKAVLM